jgi:uncharacterized protein
MVPGRAAYQVLRIMSAVPVTERMIRGIKAPVILLPPSEGKASGGKATPWTAGAHAFRELDDDRILVRDVVREVLATGDAAAGRLLRVRGRHLARAISDWGALDDGPTLPAAQRYTGVVWAALDPAGLDPSTRRRLNARVLIPSGLWGLLAAGDAIPAYRMKMSARVPPLGLLSSFWRPRVTPIIDRRAAGGWVIDLLPGEHRSAVDAAQLVRSRLLRVELYDDASRSIGHAGKTAKGLLARAILEADARTPDDVAAVSVAGLRVDDLQITSRGATLIFRSAATGA